MERLEAYHFCDIFNGNRIEDNQIKKAELLLGAQANVDGEHISQ